MAREYYKILYKTEETYWWFVCQRFLVKKYLETYYDSRNDLKILDVGCGAGINLKMLSWFGRVHGIDISQDAINFCKSRGLKSVDVANLLDLKFKNDTYDIVTALGIFYHKDVTDDLKGMREIYRVLKPGGRIFFLDSAMKCLSGNHDVFFHGARRYSRKELRSKLEKAGFRVEKISYIYTSLFLPAYIKRKLEKLGNSEPKSEVSESINPIINYIMKAIFKSEFTLVKYINYPFGTNIFAVARK